MSDEVSVEATGETVGEAKWSALRELERLAPGDRPRRGAVPGRQRGRARPARRRLHAGARGRDASSARTERAGSRASGEAAVARELLERIARRRSGVVGHGRGRARTRTTVTATVLGRRPRRPDRPARPDDRRAPVPRERDRPPRRRRRPRRIVVDAAGYRARRTSTLEALARRSAEQASRRAAGSSSSR